jgi:sigma-E factor negative regulatory protein RseA
MDSKTTTQEQISALADGEISVGQLDGILALLRDKDAQENWKLYHQIGDLLRSDDMNVRLSESFSARLSARLEAEPTIMAPAATLQNIPALSQGNEAQNNVRPAKLVGRRWAIPGMAAAAAMAAIAFVSTPQLMVALKGTSPSSPASISVAGNNAGDLSTGGGGKETVMAASSTGEMVVRDPRIDDYLLAHQRYSPSVYSTAQYARSATFATESNK